jgi:hypothetical protein
MGFFDDPNELEVRTYPFATARPKSFRWVVHRPSDCKDLDSGTVVGSERDAKREGERAKDGILEKQKRRHD